LEGVREGRRPRRRASSRARRLTVGARIGAGIGQSPGCSLSRLLTDRGNLGSRGKDRQGYKFNGPRDFGGAPLAAARWCRPRCWPCEAPRAARSCPWVASRDAPGRVRRPPSSSRPPFAAPPAAVPHARGAALGAPSSAARRRQPRCWPLKAPGNARGCAPTTRAAPGRARWPSASSWPTYSPSAVARAGPSRVAVAFVRHHRGPSPQFKAPQAARRCNCASRNEQVRVWMPPRPTRSFCVPRAAECPDAPSTGQAEGNQNASKLKDG